MTILAAIILVCCFGACLPAQAQVGVSFETLFFSRHVWRGEQMGNAPAVEPSLTLSRGAFSLELWAARTLNNSYSEVDIIPSVQLGELTLTLFDYYNPVPGEENRFFRFSEDRSRHSVELCLDNKAGDAFPLKWMAGVFLLGDKNPETGKPFYSTYLELSYPLYVGGIKIDPQLGLTPRKGYYASRAAVLQTGLSASYEVKTNRLVVFPLRISLLHNPYAGNSFAIFAAGFSF